jgi:hypothetical protein
MMKFEYQFVQYRQVKTGYRFFLNFQDEGITVPSVEEILPVLNHFGAEGWEFICWDSGRLLFKRRC